MKKSYVRPVIEIHRVTVENVIATSPTAKPNGEVKVENFGDEEPYYSDDVLLF